MHLAPLIRDLAVILSVAGVVTLIFQRIKQPVVLGYIIAGMVVGPHTPPFPLVRDIPNIQTLAELGVIFLMFSLGLEFSFRKLARVGISASFTAIFEVVTMMGLGLITGKILQWSTMDSIFLGAMLSVSSTTIIIKALDEQGLKTRRFAELIFGVLIVEDLIAILILVSLTTLATAGTLSAGVLAFSTAKLILVIGSWFLAGYFVLPRFIRYVGSFGSDEMLTVVSVGLCLSLVVFATYFNYSVALGAFIMGSILAECAESHRIELGIKSLRDLFSAIFFVSVGMLIDPISIWQHKGAVLSLTLITIVGKIISTGLGVLLTGQTLKTSVQVGFGLAQIGEFSFIIATLGLTLGVISDFLYPVIVAVSVLTTFSTPYLIRYSSAISSYLEKKLPSHVLQLLNRYALWFERLASRKTPHPDLNQALIRWVLNAFVVILICVGVISMGMPLLQKHLGESKWIPLIAWTVALIAASPFLWAMYGKLGKTYRWLEAEFTDVFKDAPHSEDKKDVFQELAPWDEHLVRIKIHADSKVAGQTLQESQLRNLFGINVVAIQRGSKTIIAPLPTQQLFPKDELLVLGSDENIDQVKKTLSQADGKNPATESIAGYDLRRMIIGSKSSLLGKSIRDAGIREHFSAMVVGVERNSRRLVSPDSDLLIESGDVLLIVGESRQLDEMIQKQKSNPTENSI